MTTVTRVGLWGVFGHGNYGNEATLTAFLNQLDSVRFEPLILTNNPHEASRLHGLPASPIGPPAYAAHGAAKLSQSISIAKNRASYLCGALRRVRALDSVVIVGTGGLEHAGAFGTPFEIWSLGLACRTLRRPFVLLNIGVDRAHSRVTRMFVRESGRLAAYRSYRDERSRLNMVATGLHAGAGDPVVTDMALSLEPPRAPVRDPRHVVVGVLDYDGVYGDDPSARDGYLRRCVRLVDGLCAEGYHVTIVAGDDDDVPTAQCIATRFPSDAVTLSKAKTPHELTVVMSEASTVIAARYHTLIMGLLAGTPIVSIGYSEKHRHILRQFSLPEVHRDSSEFDPADVVALVSESIAHQRHLSARIEEGLARARRQLDRNWEDALVTISRRSHTLG